jgi:hypothetical protein
MDRRQLWRHLRRAWIALGIRVTSVFTLPPALDFLLIASRSRAA